MYSNARTTVMAKKDGAEGWKGSFNTAFRAGTQWAATFAWVATSEGLQFRGLQLWLGGEGLASRVERGGVSDQRFSGWQPVRAGSGWANTEE